MVEAEVEDIITYQNTSFAAEEAGDENEPEDNEPKSCCRCDEVLLCDQEVFDNDSCTHQVCVKCRFRDSVICRLCTSINTVSNTPKEVRSDSFSEEKSLFIGNEVDNSLVSPFKNYFLFSRKKKINTDHIVDVEKDENNVQKQKCTICERVFKKTNARYHYACASGDKPFSCVECNQKFVKKSHMEAHMNSHYGIKPFKCTVPKCKASFTQKDKLKRHMKSHNKDWNFRCQVCDKFFNSQGVLNDHLEKVHSSLKPFQCDMCPRSYKYKKSLRVHRLKHLALKEYMCEVCGKKYTLFAQLKHHKRSHILYHRRPHKCSCGRRFMTRRDRARHELIHTTSHDFECSICKKTFGRKDNLERHMKNFHQDDPPVLGKAKKLTAVVNPIQKSSKSNSDNNTATNSNEVNEIEKSKTYSKVKTKKINNTNTFLKKFKRKKKTNSENHKSDMQMKGTLSSHKNTVEETKSKETSSVPLPPNMSDNQNRPSVIKTIPKLLSYKVLPPDKRFLKMTEEISKGKRLSEIVPLPTPRVNCKSNANLVSAVSSSERNIGSCSTHNELSNIKNSVDSVKIKAHLPKPKTSHTHKKKIPKDDALNRCFRIIQHTSSVFVHQTQFQNVPVDYRTRIVEDLSKTNATRNNNLESVPLVNKHLRTSCTYNTPYPISSLNRRFLQEFDRCSSETSTLNLRNPRVTKVSNTNPLIQMSASSLSLESIPENITDINQEDNFSTSYIPLSDSSFSSYTPYFGNDCFGDSTNSSYYDGNVEQLLPNDFDM